MARGWQPSGQAAGSQPGIGATSQGSVQGRGEGVKVCLYTRVSTDSQDAMNQVMELRAWAERQGHTVVQEYQDVASGARRRERLDDLFDDARRRKFDLVAVWSLDRLTREGPLACLLYLQRLTTMGIRVYSHQEPYLQVPCVAVAHYIGREVIARQAVPEKRFFGVAGKSCCTGDTKGAMGLPVGFAFGNFLGDFEIKRQVLATHIVPFEIRRRVSSSSGHSLPFH